MYKNESKVKAGKSRMMVFERKEVEGFNFSISYRMSVIVVGRCDLVLGERMEEGKEFMC